MFWKLREIRLKKAAKKRILNDYLRVYSPIKIILEIEAKRDIPKRFRKELFQPQMKEFCIFKITITKWRELMWLKRTKENS